MAASPIVHLPVGSRVRIRPQDLKKTDPLICGNDAIVTGFEKDDSLTHMNGVGIEVWRAVLLFDSYPYMMTTDEILRRENHIFSVLPMVLEHIH